MNNPDHSSDYDSLPYASSAYAESHPALLAGIGRLLGLDSPDPANCRVLELACADGTNLLPMACEFPNSEFVGIDLSQAQ
ncbi:MAG: class I SAM-dependent methyltransferase, partial [Gammaproteobacteria bacterium]|nr:class I SAM-dependent methyltransferase [Gammaproteobacteria bacterium]